MSSDRSASNHLAVPSRSPKPPVPSRVLRSRPTVSGSVDINTVGSVVGGIFARNIGTAGLSDFTIRTGEISAADANQYAVYALIRNSFSPSSGRNLSVTTEGNVLGYIYMSSQGTGTVDLTTKGTVTGDVNVEATNQTSNGAFTVNLNQLVTGNVSLTDYGMGSATVHTGNIAGTFAASSYGANSSVVVDGNITRGTVADRFVSGTLAGVYFPGGGTNTATFNGAISGTFDASSSTSSTMNGRASGLSATFGSTTSNGSGTLTANGPITVTGIARPGDAAT